MDIRGTKLFFVSATLACVTGLSACGGGGGADTTSGGGSKTISASTCEAVAGPLDQVQAAISGHLLPGGTTFPVAGAVPGLLTAALSRLLDTPDALANGLKSLATDRSPTAFANVLAKGGDSLSCGLSDIQVALIELNKQAAAAGSAVPGLAQALAQVQMVQNLLLGATSGDVSLAEIADAVGDLQVLLNQVRTALPAQLQNPATLFAFNTLGITTTHIAQLLRELGDFDGAGVTTELTATVNALITAITASPMGLPTDKLAPITAALTTVINTTLPKLTPIITPLLNALKSILQPQSGDPAAMFQDILAGGLAGTPLNGVFATLLGKLNGGGTAGGLPIPVLGPLLETVLGGLLGGLLGGGN